MVLIRKKNITESIWLPVPTKPWVQTEMLEAAFPGFKAPVSAKEMASYIMDFALTGHQFYNGKVLEVSSTTP